MVLSTGFELWLLCFLNGILVRKKGREGVVAGFGWVWWQGKVRIVGEIQKIKRRGLNRLFKYIQSHNSS
ncbi:hypothetical protein GBA52_003517 [Prunus armeniaca]|nr:hypothetical protein GBA52_003517 [Prunus armeniaca]